MGFGDLPGVSLNGPCEIDQVPGDLVNLLCNHGGVLCYQVPEEVRREGLGQSKHGNRGIVDLVSYACRRLLDAKVPITGCESGLSHVGLGRSFHIGNLNFSFFRGGRRRCGFLDVAGHHPLPLGVNGNLFLVGRRRHKHVLGTLDWAGVRALLPDTVMCYCVRRPGGVKSPVSGHQVKAKHHMQEILMRHECTSTQGRSHWGVGLAVARYYLRRRTGQTSTIPELWPGLSSRQAPKVGQ